MTSPKLIGNKNYQKSNGDDLVAQKTPNFDLTANKPFEFFRTAIRTDWARSQSFHRTYEGLA
jgi:hypothetical protein